RAPRPLARGGVVVRGDEDDRDRPVRPGETLLHFEAAEPGEVDVEDQAVEAIQLLGGQQLLAGAERLHGEACSTQQALQRTEDRPFVVDDADAHAVECGGRALDHLYTHVRSYVRVRRSRYRALVLSLSANGTEYCKARAAIRRTVTR